ncbi:MAG: FkbM family methyltransferase [Cyanobacteria bacterium P01_C01_bin.120]
MEIYLLNYADDRFGHKGGRFIKNQKNLNESAKRQGIKNIISWSWPTFSATSFYDKNQEYLDKNRFENGAVWKPFIVQNLLDKIDNGDVIFYYDCGRYEINRPVDTLVKLCEKNGGTLFHEWGEKNSKYTKRDAFVYMDCDSQKFYGAKALQNTWFLLQKNEFTQKFVNEWLQFNLDERIASYVKPNTCGLPNILGFVENRGDQTIFSNLAIKYNLRTFAGAGGVKNRQVDNFVDSLALSARAKHFIFKSQKQLKSSIKSAAYQARGINRSLNFKVKDEPFCLYPAGGAVKELWIQASSKQQTLRAILSLIAPDSKIVEVGSNVGVTTIPMALRAVQGKVCAIEADPNLCTLLAKNLELNACAEHVSIAPVAVCEQASSVMLQINRQGRDTFNTVGKPIDENCDIVAVKEVPAQSLTQILNEQTFPQPDLLLIDASGAELPILKGATAILEKDSAPIVIYNCLHRACLGFDYQPSEIQEFLRAYGYHLYKMGTTQDLEELPEKSQHEGFIFGFKNGSNNRFP